MHLQGVPFKMQPEQQACTTLQKRNQKLFPRDYLKFPRDTRGTVSLVITLLLTQAAQMRAWCIQEQNCVQSLKVLLLFIKTYQCVSRQGSNE
jgi:hypothetical protein